LRARHGLDATLVDRHRCPVTGNELLRKLRRLARRRGVQFKLDAAGGKGGHGLIVFDRRRTTLRSSRQKEIPTGALRGMLSDLGLAPKDLA
jgi:mRNA interferase HicA